VPSPDSCDEHVAWAVREWPDIDPDVEGITSRVATAERYLQRAASDTLDALDLAHGEFKVLIRLSRAPRSHGDIARELLVSTGTMTNRLDKLESAGLIRRRPDPGDRRGVIVELTAKGRATVDRYIAAQGKRERQLLSHLTAGERRSLSDLLRKLVASIAAESGS
jgi:DNA-binding MarR family transcriptional regulator